MDMVQVNRQKVRDYLKQSGLDAVILTKRSNFAWYTGGKDNHIVLATEEGVATLVITPNADYCVCQNIEAPRMIREELDGLGIDVRPYPWYESPDSLIRELVGNGRCASDTGTGFPPLGPDFQRLRYSLSEAEQATIRELGCVTAQLFERVCKAIKPGDTEHQVAGALSEAFVSNGIQLPVVLVASDERVRSFRHPIPTSKTIDRYVMAVIMAESKGLMVAMTRLVHFGAVPADLKQRMEATARIDATMIANTRPGVRVADIFAKGIEEYAKAGYPDEWKLHHQGGPCGYWTREYVATPSVEEVVVVNQPFAWNPSITGTKCEDTCIAGETDTEIITATGNWPTIAVQVGDKVYQRPDILASHLYS